MSMALQLNSLCIGYEQSQCSQSCRTDGEAFTHSSSGVTNCVQLICDLTDGVIQTGHLSDTAGIIGDGTVSVNSYGDTGGGQHTDSCQRDTVQTA